MAIKNAYSIIKEKEPFFLTKLTIAQKNDLRSISAEIGEPNVLLSEFRASSRAERWQNFGPNSVSRHVPVDTIYYHTATRSDYPNDGSVVYLDAAGTTFLPKAHPLIGDYNYYVGEVDGEDKWFNVDANGVCSGLKTFEDIDSDG